MGTNRAARLKGYGNSIVKEVATTFIEALIDANNASGVVLGVVVAVNSVIALYYYARVGINMWAEETPDGDLTRVDMPMSLVAAIGITAIATIAFGLGLVVGDFTDVSLLALG